MNSSDNPPRPRFTDETLSRARTLDELGVSDESAAIPDGWDRAAPAPDDPEHDLDILFSRQGMRAALKRAFRRLAEHSR